jgi:hypothetical protein
MCRTPLTGVMRICLASAPVASNTNGGKAPAAPAAQPVAVAPAVSEEMAWTNGRWMELIDVTLEAMKDANFIVRAPALDLLKKQTLAVAFASLEEVSGFAEREVTDYLLRVLRRRISTAGGAAPAEVSSAAGGAAGPAPVAVAPPAPAEVSSAAGGAAPAAGPPARKRKSL